METELVIKIVTLLKTYGTKNIVFTGGEPTLIKDLPIILSETKSLGLTTVLSTNGILLSSNRLLFDRIAPKLDWISLAIDADNNLINLTMRVGQNENKISQFQTIFHLIPLIRKKQFRLKIKIGTVVTQRNKNHIQGIAKIFYQNNIIPDTWKLYQISPSEYGKVNYEKLKIDDVEFERIFADIKKIAGTYGINNVIKYANKNRPGKYLFINPRGEVLIVHGKDNDYHSVGNILVDPSRALNNWHKYVNENLLIENFDSTYPSLT